MNLYTSNLSIHGLIDTIESKYPGVEHRFCLRHMYANFKLRFKDKLLRGIMWAAARAYLSDIFENKMREMHTESPEAYAWLRAIPLRLWARHTFSPRSKCDLLCNNICECFNQYVKDARSEPVLTMFKTIRRQIMCRFQEKREWIGKVKSKICPRIVQKIEVMKNEAIHFDVLVAGSGVYEVACLNKAFVVNFLDKDHAHTMNGT